ncbi:MAG: hypothetical protein QM605_10780, partial [Sphingobium sp.]
MALRRVLTAVLVLAPMVPAATLAQTSDPVPQARDFGPYDARFVAGGIGVDTTLPATNPLVAQAGGDWTLVGWIRPDASSQPVVLARLGDGARRVE